MKNTPSITSQRGAVLIVSLLFLVVLTMLGVTAMTSTTFEERMAGNARDAAVAQLAAEAALHRARDEIDKRAIPNRDLIEASFMPPTQNGNCVQGVCQAREIPDADCCVVPPDLPANVRWTNTSGTTMQYVDNEGKGLDGVSAQPRYTIELFCFRLLNAPPGECRIYRFTAVGWGKNPNTQVTVQEIYLTPSKVVPS